MIEKTRVSPETLIPHIQRVFSAGPPNGWLLGWDENRGFDELKAVAAPWVVANCTSFDYSFCNWFEVEFDLRPFGKRVTLTVEVSFIADYYSVHWTEYSGDGRSRVVADVPQVSDVRARIVAWLERRGFVPVPDGLSSQTVPGVVLELSEPDLVNVGKCLFADFAD